MKILFSTGSLSHLPIKDVFTLAGKAGFDGCDLVIDKKFNDPQFKESVIRCLDILPVHSLHAPYERIEAWGTEVQALFRAMELAREVNAQVVTFHPPSWLAREISYYRWFRKVKDFQEELRCGSVSLSIENMPLIKLILPPYFYNHFKKLIRFGRERNLYFTFDITHLGTYSCDIVSAFLIYSDTKRLKNVHVSDYSLWREKSHLGLGRGELPIVRLLNTMRKLGYDQFITLEISPHEMPRTTEWLLQVMSYASSFLKLHSGRSVDL